MTQNISPQGIWRPPDLSLRWWPVFMRNLLVWRKLAIPSLVGNIAENIVGTPSKTVTLSRSMICSAFSGSKRGISVSVPPLAMQQLSAQVCPKEWNSGSAPRTTSLSPSSKSPRATRTLLERFEWVSSAPFGFPVVPEV